MEHMLDAIKADPDMWSAERLAYLRNFVSFACRHNFPRLPGDDTVELPLPQASKEATHGYVQALTNLESGSDVPGVGWGVNGPVLVVYAIETGHHKDVSSVVKKEEEQTVKLTTLRLVDGSGDQIHCRLAINLAETGRCLKRGDVIQLDSYTELRFRVNKTSPRLPGLFVHELSRLGHTILKDKNVKNILPMAKSLPDEHTDLFEPSSERVIDPRVDEKPECTDQNRCCAVYGIRFVNCICKCMPVDKCDLATIKEDCYFATNELDDMQPNHKRNMLYWWYATNIFSISGKGNRGKLPECLEYAIREAYPNPEGVQYKGHRGKKK